MVKVKTVEYDKGTIFSFTMKGSCCVALAVIIILAAILQTVMILLLTHGQHVIINKVDKTNELYRRSLLGKAIKGELNTTLSLSARTESDADYPDFLKEQTVEKPVSAAQKKMFLKKLKTIEEETDADSGEPLGKSTNLLSRIGKAKRKSRRHNREMESKSKSHAEHVKDKKKNHFKHVSNNVKSVGEEPKKASDNIEIEYVDLKKINKKKSKKQRRDTKNKSQRKQDKKRRSAIENTPRVDTEWPEQRDEPQRSASLWELLMGKPGAHRNYMLKELDQSEKDISENRPRARNSAFTVFGKNNKGGENDEENENNSKKGVSVSEHIGDFDNMGVHRESYAATVDGDDELNDNYQSDSAYTNYDTYYDDAIEDVNPLEKNSPNFERIEPVNNDDDSTKITHNMKHDMLTVKNPIDKAEPNFVTLKPSSMDDNDELEQDTPTERGEAIADALKKSHSDSNSGNYEHRLRHASQYPVSNMRTRRHRRT